MTCLNAGPDCQGAVEMRYPGEGEKHWPRCLHHNDQRVKKSEEHAARDEWARNRMDPADAGECWDDE